MSADIYVADCEKKRARLSLKKLNQDGYFTGYASLFDTIDLSNDIVEKGAFSRSLSIRKTRPVRMLFQHDPNQPIGRWISLVEDRNGLYVEGALSLEVERAKEIYSLMLSGALDGLSIGFKTVRSRKNSQSGVRHIIEAELWEISIVTFPMHPSARIENVKSSNLDDNGFDKQLANLIRSAASRI